MSRKMTIAILAAAVAGSALFCQQAARKDKFVKIYLPRGGSITAELAATDAERQRGLMFRENLLPDQGMLFVFEVEDTYAFWMKNTLIPLDMLWLDTDHRIVHIARNVPPCKADPCPTYAPERPGRYVLELAAGSADRLGLKLFDKLDFKI